MAARAPFNVTMKSPATATQQHSPWHSPVPYLFGGLAAMLGLIAFALLILACSYWKLSGYLDGGEGDAAGERDLEAGEGNGTDNMKAAPAKFEEKILVIMAGEVKPTFLATPIASRSSSFEDSGSSCSCKKNENLEVEKKATEMVKQGSGDQVQRQHIETHESSDQTH